MALVGVAFSMLMYHNERIRRLKVYWKSNLLPSWTQFVLTSFHHVVWLCHSFKSCALPPSLLFQWWNLQAPDIYSLAQYRESLWTPVLDHEPELGRTSEVPLLALG